MSLFSSLSLLLYRFLVRTSSICSAEVSLPPFFSGSPLSPIFIRAPSLHIHFPLSLFPPLRVPSSSLLSLPYIFLTQKSPIFIRVHLYFISHCPYPPYLPLPFVYLPSYSISIPLSFLHHLFISWPMNIFITLSILHYQNSINYSYVPVLYTVYLGIFNMVRSLF